MMSTINANESRRKELWGLLGDLPWTHRPAPPRVLEIQKHRNVTIERLVLDLNGEEDVPALLLIPEKCTIPAPAMLYIHWHGGMYDLGKEQLLMGVPAQPAYAALLAEKGVVTLAIDSWCFGQRKHSPDGRTGEMMWANSVRTSMICLIVYILRLSKISG